MLRTIRNLTINILDEGNNNKDPISEVIFDNRPTGYFVQGAILEIALQWNNRFILFLTDDIPYEEQLRIILLDDQFHIIDSAVIGSPYSTGIFSDIDLSGPNRVSFRFIGIRKWEIEILQSPRFRIPLISEPQGVWRPFGFYRHFIVRNIINS